MRPDCLTAGRSPARMGKRMQDYELQELVKRLPLEDKIAQLLQISGGSYEEENVVTGPNAMYGIGEDTVYNLGSVINCVGAARTKRIQKQYLEKSRHKIPLLFMSDIIYGLKTIFPIPLGSACSWDMEQVRESARIAAREAAAMGQHVTFSPMADLVRDARWGRVLESPGEDPYYNCEYVKACVEGFQGSREERMEYARTGQGGAADPIDAASHIASCVKHFAAYGAAEAGREYNTVDVSRRMLYEFYFPAYRAAIDAGAELVMTSFNIVDGIPSSGNEWLNREVLRKEWGFDRVLISDASAIEELVAHGVAADKREAARMAITAGVDIDMMSPVYIQNLKSLVREGEISEALIDEAVLRVLRLKNKLGLFENPYGGADEEREKEVVLCREHRAASRRLAADSCVLLKNNGILPLPKKGKKIALIGPYSDNPDLLGIWAVHGDTLDTVTIREGVEAKLRQEDETFASLPIVRGCRMVRDVSNIQSFGSIFQMEDESGLDEEELLREAKAAAMESDILVLALGEHFLQSGEGGSRGDIRLPDSQRELLRVLSGLGKPVVVLLMNGRPLDLRDVVQQADAVLECWFPGTEGGNAIADLLFGDVNPSGKLTMSFPYSVGQTPVYYNEFHTGRPYRPEFEATRFGSKYTDIPNAPLFPFGFGLSYTGFAYRELTLSSGVMRQGETVTASCMVRNTGSRDGRETVQLYIQDRVGSVVRPVKELKGFCKLFLRAGEEKQVNFEITTAMLRFYTARDVYEAEAGEFIVYVGANSRECLEETLLLE